MSTMASMSATCWESASAPGASDSVVLDPDAVPAWWAAKPSLRELTVGRRVANDGIAYTWQEFTEFYGGDEAERMWAKAAEHGTDAECEMLRMELQRANKQLRWWWKSSIGFEQELLKKEDDPYRWLSVSSPLTPNEEWDTEHKSCWKWRNFQSACPCCKRPLDVTLHRVGIGSSDPTESSAESSPPREALCRG